MSTMKIVNFNQGSDEWLDWRSHGVTASDIPIILGLSPYKTPWQLWAEKVGRINAPDISNNPNVKRGNRLEDEARQLAEKRYDEVLLPICAEYAQWDVFRASFDGLDSVYKPYEFKAPSDSVWNDIENQGVESETFKMYESQVHAQCIVSESTAGRLIFYKEDGNDMDFPVILTPERKEEILQAAQRFWKQVLTNTPPEADPLKDWFIPQPGDQMFKWNAYADSWRTQHHRIQKLKDELKSLEKEAKEIQKSMITLMGPFMQADMAGVKVTRYMKKGSIDYKTYLKDMFPDKEVEDIEDELESYRKSSREESRFSKSEDELINMDVNDVVTNVRSGYF